MNPFDILLIVAGVGYVLLRRLGGELVEVKGLLVLPVVLTGVGILQLDDLHPLDATTVAFVAAGIVLSIALGLIRGRTVHLGSRDGELWMRYRASSVGLWVLNVVIKGATVPLELAVSKDSASAANSSILLAIGLGILAESVVVVLRAMRSEATVVWAKGEDGGPHRTSPAFDRARAWLDGAAADGVRLTERISLPKHDW